jgi:uncharacterized caspase-like protein
LIGVDKYESEHIRDLTGAVADAQAVKEYLHDRLRTPYSQITTLVDTAATRDAIMTAINSLSEDDRIQDGDPILIYFAGHGSVSPAPRQWERFCSQTELIVPHDADKAAGKNLIADLQLSQCLSKIAQAKGTNIVGFDLIEY